LRRQAIFATLYALGGMLVYICNSVRMVYGAAAVIAVFHDVLITLGFFSLFITRFRYGNCGAVNIGRLSMTTPS